jgi:hypothetical protein
VVSARQPISPGIDGMPTATIPEDPDQFPIWFKTIFLRQWASKADVRNATAGPGISITGNSSTTATLAASDDLQALFEQPYVFVGGPAAGAPMTDYRSLAVQPSVLTLTDGGATNTVAVGVASNGIGNAQLRQAGANSVIGNAGGTTANVADITATIDGQVFSRVGGTIGFNNLAANPTAQVGLSAVNGSATTYMRSDGAPALSQAIAPVWTAGHTFSPSSAVPCITANANAGNSSFILGKDSSNTTQTALQGGSTLGFVGTITNHGFHIFTNNTDRISIDNAGSVLIGSATGGQQGVGTINAQGLFVNGVAVGGASVALPGTIPDLTLWIETDNILGAGNANITRIQERTPWITGLAASNLSGAVFIDPTQLNSLNVLKWPAALSSGNYPLTAGVLFNLGCTIFVVARGNVTTTDQAILGTSSAGIALYLRSTTAKLALVKGGTAVIGQSTATWSAGTAFQANVTYNQSTGAYAFRQGRATAGSGTGATGAGLTVGTANLGADGGTAFLNSAALAAVIVYNRVLSGAEITSVENYLFAKWGV